MGGERRKRYRIEEKGWTCIKMVIQKDPVRETVFDESSGQVKFSGIGKVFCLTAIKQNERVLGGL